MSLIPQVAWSELTPAGSDQINAGDNRVRELKTQIREVIDVDHDFPSSGQAADVGQHKKVTLQEQANLGTGAVGATILGSQTINGKGELVYTDEDDNDIQLTDAGEIYWKSILARVYPVGSVYTNYSDSTNPATLLGIGTWVAIEGRVVVGLDAAQTEFDTAGETGGAKTHQLTIAEMPLHGHPTRVSESTTAGPDNTGGLMIDSDYDSNKSAFTGTPDETAGHQVGGSGGDTAHNNLQPYVVCYVWRRTV